MNNGRNIQPPPGISMADIYFVVFRHKWKIILLTVAGILAAAAYYFMRQPPFQSQAELLIRYVSDKREGSPADGGGRVTSVVDLGQSVISDEMDIIRSFDLAEIAATNVGPEKILAKLGGGNDPMQAASVITRGLDVDVAHDSSVIRITFRHPDQMVVCPVIAAIIDAYYDKHQRVHAAIGISDDLLTEQTTQLREQVAQTEQELMMAKTNAGIIDFADSEKAYSAENARIRRELLQAQADLAEQKASVTEPISLPIKDPKTTNDAAALAAIPSEVLTKYKSVCARLGYLQKKHNDYLLVQGYIEENKLVQEVSGQIAATTKIKTDLEEKYPPLAELDFVPAEATATTGQTPANANELASLPTRIQVLKDQLAQIQSESAQLEEAGTKISELDHKKAVQEGNLKYFETTLQQAQIDEALGPGRVSNIQPIETPSPPYKDYSKFYKTIFSLCFGGLFVGLAWAVFIELFLDRSIKRPIEIQNKLKIPFFLSIPDLSRGNSKRSMPANRQLGYDANAVNGDGAVKTAKSGAMEMMHSEINRRFNSYYDALRDRLVIYFESINLTRKPKLVAVTSTHKGSGVSTIAAGLAASLSETGDGRVLLVDMNGESGSARQFFRGEAGCKLDDALISDKRESAMVQDNLYVVTEDIISDKLPRALPRRFASLIPQLKASDYDYIIFDMPPVSPTSVTSRLAGFMDTVMLVIESEKTDQQVVQQATALLAQSKANVTAVLNKTKHYIPARLHQDFLSDT